MRRAATRLRTAMAVNSLASVLQILADANGEAGAITITDRSVALGLFFVRRGSAQA